MELGLSNNSMSFMDSQHDKQVLENLRSQQEAGRFCDVVLHVEGKIYHAHRCILAANSPYFDSVLKAHKIIREQYNVSCQNQATFQLFLKFLYTGSVLIDQDNILDLLNLASTLLIFKLQLYCSEFLENCLTVENCLSLRDLADKYCLEYLKNSVSQFIDNHFIELFKRRQLLSFSLQKLESFLNAKYCTLPQENLMYFIADWIKFNYAERERDLRNLLTFIDWKTLNHSLILNHLQKEKLYLENEKCLFVFLEVLSENKIKMPSFDSRYQELRIKFQPNLDEKLDSSVILDMAISLALSGLQPKGALTEKDLSSTYDSDDRHGTDKEVTRKENKSDELEEDRNQHIKQVTGTNQNSEKQENQTSQTVPISVDADSPASSKQTPSDNRHKRKIDCPRKRISNPSTTPPLPVAQDQIAPADQSKEGPDLPPTVGNLPPVVSAYLESTDEYEIETESSDDDEPADDSGSFPGLGKGLLWKEGVKCPHCSYLAHSSLRFEQHLANTHTKSVSYKCSICGVSSRWNQDYLNHMKIHFNGPPFSCESCDYSCDKIQRLLTHRKIHVDVKPYKCGECDFSCLNKGSLTAHMRCHTGIKPFRCADCGRRFTAKHLLKQHAQCHIKDRPFHCDTCDFSTKSKEHLTSHVNSHTADTLHCDFPECTFSCTKKSQLTAHTKCHRSMRSHICPVCGRGFAERSHLVRHERIHLTDKPFKCNDCDYTSSRRDKLKEHVQKHHSADATAKLPYKPRRTRRLGRSGGARGNQHHQNTVPPLPQLSAQLNPAANNTNLNIYNYDQCSRPRAKESQSHVSNTNDSLHLFPHFPSLLPHLSNTALGQAAFFPSNSRLDQLMSESAFSRLLNRNHNGQSSHSFHPQNMMPQDLSALGAYMSLF